MVATDLPTSYIRIDLGALTANLQAVQQHVGDSIQVMPVIKANAYGHGMIPVARTLVDAGVSRLAVARPAEGAELRGAGIQTPVLILGYALPSEAGLYAEHNLTATVNTVEMAEALADQAVKRGIWLAVHVKIDTGLNRYGLLPDQAVGLIQHITTLPNLILEGLYTHFAAADETDKSLAQRQIRTFTETADLIERKGIPIPIRHAANSAGIIDLPEAHFNCVRPGIILYGLRPSGEVADFPLKPVLSLHSHIARIHTIPHGEGVSYGWEFVADRPTDVALIPVGYGDGYPRSLTHTGFVLIRGHRARIIGRVCMDQIMVDVTDVPGVMQDDPVILIGGEGENAVTADVLAGLAGTINYEITTRLMPRLPRIYIPTPPVSQTPSSAPAPDATPAPVR